MAMMAEVRIYYPNLRVTPVIDGIWVVTQIYPIGRDGPFFTVCLFLHDDNGFDAKAFAFERDGRSGRPVGSRHTNFPDASICSYSAQDGVWEPGDSPLGLLNLYAEWLVCQLFLREFGFWPGAQSGLNATYRIAEFKSEEWCDCGSGRRYGECHQGRDKQEVQRLICLSQYVPLPHRAVPLPVVKFAKTKWGLPPESHEIHLKSFLSADHARLVYLSRFS
jgi:hypothetical protein